MKKLILIALLVFMSSLFFKTKATTYINVWKDSLGNYELLNKSIIPNDSFKFSYIKKLNLKAGVYIVYIGDNDLPNYQFPDYEFSYDTCDFFDQPLFLANDHVKCIPIAVSLVDGKWLKIIVNNTKKGLEIVREKNIRNGNLHGVWELRKGKFHSYLLYEDGFVKYRKLINDKGNVSMLGTYSTCDKIIEEKIWHDNKKLYKHFKDGKVRFYNEKGKLVYIKNTDSWGEVIP